MKRNYLVYAIVCGLFALLVLIDIMLYPMNPYIMKTAYILTWVTLLGCEFRKIYVTLKKGEEKADYSNAIIIIVATAVFALDMFR